MPETYDELRNCVRDLRQERDELREELESTKVARNVLGTSLKERDAALVLAQEALRPFAEGRGVAADVLAAHRALSQPAMQRAVELASAKDACLDSMRDPEGCAWCGSVYSEREENGEARHDMGCPFEHLERLEAEK